MPLASFYPSLLDFLILGPKGWQIGINNLKPSLSILGNVYFSLTLYIAPTVHIIHSVFRYYRQGIPVRLYSVVGDLRRTRLLTSLSIIILVPAGRQIGIKHFKLFPSAVGMAYF